MSRHHCLGSFHMVEFAALEYDHWDVRLHGSEACLNLPFETVHVRLKPPSSGIVESLGLIVAIVAVKALSWGSFAFPLIARHY
ncbi:Bifunctional dihydroflavonol 4-reductase/flavanone 4-reductase [Hordeum vulgare]|nr:Bifunctional dihydroflavonol 4-reductase/flavanone 4-reductase [Hordeum vulgare]